MWCAKVLPFLLVKPCNSALRWANLRCAIAVGLMQRCFVQAFALWHNERLTIEKGDFQRTDGINMNFYGVKVTNLF